MKSPDSAPAELEKLDPPPPGPIRLGRANALFVLAGLLLVFLVLYRVGFREVGDHLFALGFAAPLILVPYAVGAFFDVLGWARAFVGSARGKVSLAKLYAIRLAGEAINNVTPSGGLVGEPLKAYLLRRHGVPTGAAVASVVVAKTALVTGQIFFTLLGLVCFAHLLGLLRARALWLAGAWAAGALVVAAIIAGQSARLLVRLARSLRVLRLRPRLQSRIERRAAEIDHILAEFYRKDHRGFVFVVAYHLVAWFVGVGEVLLLFWLMGVRCTWEQALVVESLTQATMALGSVVLPGGLGVHELGGALLCRLLGLGEAAGMALALLKRVRELVFSVLGFLLTPWLSGGGAG